MSACPKVSVFTALYHLDLCSTLLPCIYCRFELCSPPLSFIVCFYFLWSLHLVIIIFLLVISTMKWWPCFLLDLYYYYYFFSNTWDDGIRNYFVMEYIPHPVIASVLSYTTLFLPFFLWSVITLDLSHFFFCLLLFGFFFYYLLVPLVSSSDPFFRFLYSSDFRILRGGDLQMKRARKQASPHALRL